MSLLQLIFIAVTFLLALVASWGLLMPFFRSEEPLLAGDSEVQLLDLVQRRERLLQALEDLEHEHSLGKVSAEAYEQTKAELTRETAECLAAFDRMGEERADELPSRP
ncbi:MAG: hypothetical protein KDD69_09060 [Bdellovibrionales bacterium]|nr:hypothetical protein [Bdellovibrionales bacterium]